MVLEVVPAARKIGEEALRVVVVACVDADLLVEGGVHEIDVANVAKEEGEGGEALRVVEDGCVEDDVRLLVGPALEVLAADDVHDALVGVGITAPTALWIPTSNR